MTLPQCYVGVDVSKNWIDVFVASTQNLTRIANRQSSLAEWVTGLGEVTVIFEATGRYDHELRTCLDEAGIPYVRMNPLRHASLTVLPVSWPRQTGSMRASCAGWAKHCDPNLPCQRSRPSTPP